MIGLWTYTKLAQLARKFVIFSYLLQDYCPQDENDEAAHSLDDIPVAFP